MNITKEHREILQEFIDSYTIYADLNNLAEVREKAYEGMKRFEAKYPIYKGRLTLTKVESKGPGHVVIEIKTRKDCQLSKVGLPPDLQQKYEEFEERLKQSRTEQE